MRSLAEIKGTKPVGGMLKNKNLFRPRTSKPDSLKLQKAKAGRITLLDIIKVLEPYSLYPRTELSRLLKMYSFLILYYAKLGKVVNIPYVGSLMAVERPLAKAYMQYKYKELSYGQNYWVLGFSPAGFARWFLNPELFSPLRLDKVPGYFRKLLEFQKEMYHHQLSFDWNKFMPHTNNLKVALNYVLSLRNKSETLTRLAVRCGAIPFTSTLDCK